MKTTKMNKISSNRYISDITDFMDDHLLVKFRSPYNTYLQSSREMGESMFIKLFDEIVGYVEITNSTIKSIMLFLSNDNSLYSPKISSDLMTLRYSGCFVEKK